jgi:hypothetical protein
MKLEVRAGLLVSVIAYVAKLDQRCSPSEMIGAPVCSRCSIESLTALSCSASSCSRVISPASYRAYASCSQLGRGSEPTGSVGIPVAVLGS